ncbi:hypothetical protein [Mycoplasma struthionis]|uniref:Variable surface lipoprotein n=1 Tax=Mycoplasma struthionis TaxID=538220 RepID=A0A502M963_9MOLU|nr:hypothetical protein [Mycoplasma struthionis]TPI02329.1 hypothetical protein FJM01_01090 [Mycoplasma struthionis]
MKRSKKLLFLLATPLPLVAILPVAMSCGSNSNADKTTTKNVETPDSTSKEGTEGAPAVEKENKNPENTGNQNGNASSNGNENTNVEAPTTSPTAPLMKLLSHLITIMKVKMQLLHLKTLQ